LDEVRGTDERVVVAFSWSAQDGSRTRRAQLLTLRNGKIVRMKDYAKPLKALRVVGTPPVALPNDRDA
jgi:ketosteroid isomerase-like protein